MVRTFPPPPASIWRVSVNPLSLARSLARSRSIVRDAMVEVMVDAVAPPQHQQQQQLLSLAEHDHDLERDHHQHPGGRGGAGGTYGVAGERHGFGSRSGSGLGYGGRGFEDGEMETGWSGGLVGPAASANPRRCMMWCAIALGALVRGAPIEHVRPPVQQHVKLPFA